MHLDPVEHAEARHLGVDDKGDVAGWHVHVAHQLEAQQAGAL